MREYEYRGFKIIEKVKKNEDDYNFYCYIYGYQIFEDDNWNEVIEFIDDYYRYADII